MRFHKIEEHYRTPVGREMIGFGRGSADFAGLIRDAQKFFVGDVGVLESIVMPTAMPRLPYSMCMFEFEDLDPNGRRCQFFVLAEELGDTTPACDTVRVHSFITFSKLNDFFLHNGYVEINRSTNAFSTFINKETVRFLGSGPTFAGVADAGQVEDSVTASVQWLARFLSVLNCSNVDVVEIEAPSALNKRRVKNNRIPLYSYKTLVIKARHRQMLRGNGSHESPRVHLRRGHIKRRKTGNFWWEPCAVGNRQRGMVVKDYRADAMLAADVMVRA